jgi:imidazolonepropionase-like amidohydrolase
MMDSATQGYRVGWLIDGSGEPAVERRTILVGHGTIQHILSPGEPEPDTVPIIDLSTCTVFPALVDSHVHLVMSGSTETTLRRDQLNSTYAQRRATISRHLRQHLAHGVLAVRDGADNHGDVLRFKHDPAHSPPSMVTVAAAGRARRAPGRYGKLIGIEVGEDQRLVDSAFASPSRRDHLKLVNSGLNSLTQFGVETPPQFDANDLSAVIAAARRRGQPTMVHANGHLPVQLAIEAGCDSIEHGFFMGRDNLRRLADNDVTWVPTAVTMKAYSDYLQRQGHRSDPSFADVSRKNLDHQLEQIGIAREWGVRLAVGTDAGSPGVHHGSSLKEELGLFVTAGFSVEAALQCASSHGARLMGLGDRGHIAPGMRADWMAVEGPPERVLEQLHRITHRLVAGHPIDADGNLVTDQA